MAIPRVLARHQRDRGATGLPSCGLYWSEDFLNSSTVARAPTPIAPATLSACSVASDHVLGAKVQLPGHGDCKLLSAAG